MGNLMRLMGEISRKPRTYIRMTTGRWQETVESAAALDIHN